MQKRILLILGITFVGSILVILLFENSLQNNQKGSFTRQWNNILYDKQVFDLKHTGYYIAGFSSGDIFLGHKNVPSELLKLSGDSLSPVVLNSDFPTGRTRISVLEKNLFEVNQNLNLLLSGSMDSLSFTTVLMEDEPFADAVYLSPSSWVLRVINIAQSSSSLIKGSTSPSSETNEVYTLEKQVDGIFCTDGILVTTPTRILYTYYYRNEILVFDTTLTVTHRFHTIDTVKTANIQLDSSFIHGTRQLTTPPPFVNRRVAVSDDYVFVNSTIKSTNELSHQRSSSMIDIYQLPHGSYMGSFNLPAYNNISMKEFRVHHNNLYSLHGQYLITYRLTNLF